MIEAKVIRDSVAPTGNRLTTFQLRYPKFVHGEFMTHRVFSRNASSSRAIPVKKMIAEVRSDAERASPVFWGREQKGMQAVEELDDANRTIPVTSILTNSETDYFTERDAAKKIWSNAAYWAAEHAEYMADLGVHKQVVNRILEPFLHINVVCSATEYDNFFGLRLDKAAQPEMRALAETMWAAYNDSAPDSLKPGDWHLPYLVEGDYDPIRAAARVRHDGPRDGALEGLTAQDIAIKVSVARCARVSYKSFETGRPSTVDEDLALYRRLLGGEPIHASPAEHQATPDQYYTPKEFMKKGTDWLNQAKHGNFVGWIQHRKTLQGEAVAPLPEGYEKPNQNDGKYDDFRSE